MEQQITEDFVTGTTNTQQQATHAPRQAGSRISEEQLEALLSQARQVGELHARHKDGALGNSSILDQKKRELESSHARLNSVLTEKNQRDALSAAIQDAQRIGGGLWASAMSAATVIDHELHGGFGFGTDAQVVFRQLEGRSKAEIDLISAAYTKVVNDKGRWRLTSRDLRTALTKEFYGSDETRALLLLDGAENPLSAAKSRAYELQSIMQSTDASSKPERLREIYRRSSPEEINAFEAQEVQLTRHDHARSSRLIAALPSDEQDFFNRRRSGDIIGAYVSDIARNIDRRTGLINDEDGFFDALSRIPSKDASEITNRFINEIGKRPSEFASATWSDLSERENALRVARTEFLENGNHLASRAVAVTAATEAPSSTWEGIKRMLGLGVDERTILSSFSQQRRENDALEVFAALIQNDSAVTNRLNTLLSDQQVNQYLIQPDGRFSERSARQLAEMAEYAELSPATANEYEKSALGIVRTAREAAISRRNEVLSTHATKEANLRAMGTPRNRAESVEFVGLATSLHNTGTGLYKRIFGGSALTPRARGVFEDALRDADKQPNTLNSAQVITAAQSTADAMRSDSESRQAITGIATNTATVLAAVGSAVLTRSNTSVAGIAARSSLSTYGLRAGAELALDGGTTATQQLEHIKATLGNTVGVTAAVKAGGLLTSQPRIAAAIERFPVQTRPLAVSATVGAIADSATSTLHTITSSDTWENGIGSGALQVGIGALGSSIRGAGLGAAIGTAPVAWSAARTQLSRVRPVRGTPAAGGSPSTPPPAGGNSPNSASSTTGSPSGNSPVNHTQPSTSGYHLDQLADDLSSARLAKDAGKEKLTRQQVAALNPTDAAMVMARSDDIVDGASVLARSSRIRSDVDYMVSQSTGRMTREKVDNLTNYQSRISKATNRSVAEKDAIDDGFRSAHSGRAPTAEESEVALKLAKDRQQLSQPGATEAQRKAFESDLELQSHNPVIRREYDRLINEGQSTVAAPERRFTLRNRGQVIGAAVGGAAAVAAGIHHGLFEDVNVENKRPEAAESTPGAGASTSAAESQADLSEPATQAISPEELFAAGQARFNAILEETAVNATSEEQKLLLAAAFIGREPYSGDIITALGRNDQAMTGLVKEQLSEGWSNLQALVGQDPVSRVAFNRLQDETDFATVLHQYYSALEFQDPSSQEWVVYTPEAVKQMTDAALQVIRQSTAEAELQQGQSINAPVSEISQQLEAVPGNMVSAATEVSRFSELDRQPQVDQNALRAVTEVAGRTHENLLPGKLQEIIGKDTPREEQIEIALQAIAPAARGNNPGAEQISLLLRNHPVEMQEALEIYGRLQKEGIA